MDTAELQAFLERMTATAMVNQAALKCLSLGIPLKPENVEFFIDDFGFDPEKPEFAGLIDKVRHAIEVFDTDLYRQRGN